MKITFYSTKRYSQVSFENANKHFCHEITFLECSLSCETVHLARQADAVCIFVNDQCDKNIIETLSRQGVRFVLLRCAGFNNVDIQLAHQFGIKVARVPAYSPHAVAEHAVALLQTLNRKIHKAYNRVREGNFELSGLVGFDLFGKTVGVIGAGKIGECFARIMLGFGCRVLIFEPNPSEGLRALAVEIVELNQLLEASDIISLHCPLNDATHYLINKTSLQHMQKGVVLINTSRGAIIDTRAVIEALKSKRIGALGLDVYEEEEQLFFQDRSGEIIQDDVIERLMTFPNVVVTGHQAFLTNEALHNIAETTLENAGQLASGQCQNVVNA